MKHLIPLLLLSSLVPHPSSLFAAVPLKWTVETSRAQPATFEAYQGETLDFEAALQSYGKPLEAPLNYAFYWQTNGMGNAWWSAPCANNQQPPPNNLLRATWSPEYDVGAKAYNCFIGLTGSIFRAAFQLRLRPSPGAVPNEMPLPTPVIDFSRVTVLNPPWSGGGGSNLDTNTVAEIANHAIITNNLIIRNPHIEDLTMRVFGMENNKADVTDLTSSVSSLSSSKRDVDDNSFSGNMELGGGNLNIFSPFGVTAHYFNLSTHYTFDEGWSNITVSTSETTETLPEYLDRRLPSSPSLRVYDAARGCWWIGAMVDGVINWTVEE